MPCKSLFCIDELYQSHSKPTIFMEVRHLVLSSGTYYQQVSVGNNFT